VIETARLRLRRIDAGDVDALARIFGDPEVMRYVAAGRPLSRDEVVGMMERIDRRFETDGFGQLAVERRADGEVIGRAGLLPLEPETWRSDSRAALGQDAEIEIGWTLARAAWGHGYAFEAASAVVEWARTGLALERLVSIIQLGNERSIRLAQRLGARHERDIVTSFGKPAHLYATDLAV
jgi:RimJ/RimL family protein N-acetyltransferase